MGADRSLSLITILRFLLFLEDGLTGSSLSNFQLNHVYPFAALGQSKKFDAHKEGIFQYTRSYAHSWLLFSFRVPFPFQLEDSLLSRLLETGLSILSWSRRRLFHVVLHSRPSWLQRSRELGNRSPVMTSPGISEKMPSVDNPRPALAMSHVLNRTQRSIQSSSMPIQLKALLVALQPSFIKHRSSRAPSKDEKLHQIAALDGLRGLACLFVFNEVGFANPVERSSTDCR